LEQIVKLHETPYKLHIYTRSPPTHPHPSPSSYLFFIFQEKRSVIFTVNRKRRMNFLNKFNRKHSVADKTC